MTYRPKLVSQSWNPSCEIHLYLIRPFAVVHFIYYVLLKLWPIIIEECIKCLHNTWVVMLRWPQGLKCHYLVTTVHHINIAKSRRALWALFITWTLGWCQFCVIWPSSFYNQCAHCDDDCVLAETSQIFSHPGHRISTSTAESSEKSLAGVIRLSPKTIFQNFS